MDHKELIIYIKNYDLDNGIKMFRESLIASGTLDRYLKKNTIDDLYNFSKSFWENPTQSIKKLKDKYKVPVNISYRDIIKGFEAANYIEFLNSYYKQDCDIQTLSEKFCIPYDRANELILDIRYESDELCPECFNNKFYLSKDTEKLELICDNCRQHLDADKLLDKSSALEIINNRKKQLEEFKEQINQIKNELRDIKCPKCQNELVIHDYGHEFKYVIKCSECDFQSNDIEKTKELYSLWKKRAAMMIKIRAREEELLERLLDYKSEDKVVVRKEDIITEEVSNNAIKYIFDSSDADDNELWRSYYSQVRKLKRLEKIIFVDLLKQVKSEGRIVRLTYVSKAIDIYLYSPEEPIVSELIRITKIIVVRQVLRNLIDKNLIIINEKNNDVFVPQVLVKNIDLIIKLLEFQNINSQVRYLVFNRQKFSCYCCGETGRPLKIAYLDSSKNCNDLNSIIGICDDCYEVVTQNEILIDATLVFGEDNNISDESEPWMFLVKYLPEVSENEVIYDKVKEWNESYETEDIIKALAISINKMDNGELEKTNSRFISYTSAILRNGTIKIWKSIIDKFKLEEWIDIII